MVMIKICLGLAVLNMILREFQDQDQDHDDFALLFKIFYSSYLKCLVCSVYLWIEGSIIEKNKNKYFFVNIPLFTDDQIKFYKINT